MCVNTRYINSTRDTSTVDHNHTNRSSEDVPLVEFMYLACQVRVTIGNLGLCCYGCMSFITQRKANESIKVLFETGDGGGLFLTCKH